MGRTILEIQAQMDAEQALQTGLSGLNSPSQVAIYTLWKYIVSACIYYHELLWDIFKTEIETIVDNAPIGTDGWVQKKAFDFQYDATTPQVVTLVDFVPAYNPIVDAFKIITRCSVKTLPNKIVSIKVAKGTTPTALAGLELTAFSSYLNEISFAGVRYNAVSLTSDKLYLDANINYNGQYSTVISATVIAAINTYLANIDFDGDIRVVDVVDAIQGVAGVVDVVINDLAIRANTTLFANKTYLVQNKTTLLNKYPMASGYAVEETTGGQTFTDKLVFIPE